MKLSWLLTKRFFIYWFALVFFAPREHKIVFLFALDEAAKQLTEKMEAEAKGRFERLRDESGQAIIEVAMCLPIFILLAFGMIDIQWALSDAGNLNYIVQETARCQAINGLPCALPNTPSGYAQTQITNLHMSLQQFQALGWGCSAGSGTCTFVASYSFKGLGPWFPAIVITRTGTAAIRAGS